MFWNKRIEQLNPSLLEFLFQLLSSHKGHAAKFEGETREISNLNQAGMKKLRWPCAQKCAKRWQWCEQNTWHLYTTSTQSQRQKHEALLNVKWLTAEWLFFFPSYKVTRQCMFGKGLFDVFFRTSKLVELLDSFLLFLSFTLLLWQDLLVHHKGYNGQVLSGSVS